MPRRAGTNAINFDSSGRLDFYSATETSVNSTVMVDSILRVRDVPASCAVEILAGRRRDRANAIPRAERLMAEMPTQPA